MNLKTKARLRAHLLRAAERISRRYEGEGVPAADSSGYITTAVEDSSECHDDFVELSDLLGDFRRDPDDVFKDPFVPGVLGTPAHEEALGHRVLFLLFVREYVRSL